MGNHFPAQEGRPGQDEGRHWERRDGQAHKQKVRRRCRPWEDTTLLGRGHREQVRGGKALNSGPHPGHQPSCKPRHREPGRGQRKGLGLWSLLHPVHFLGQQSRRGPGNATERPRDQHETKGEAATSTGQRLAWPDAGAEDKGRFSQAPRGSEGVWAAGETGQHC